MGFQSATVKQVQEIIVSENIYRELRAQIQRLVPPDVLHESYIGGGSMIDAYCCTMCCSHFSDIQSPSNSYLPDRQQSREQMRSFLEPQLETPEGRYLGNAAVKYLNCVMNYCKGRSFFTTEEGYIGLGPTGAKAGDQICVLLGCRSPLLLRMTGNMQYQVVGECFVYGLQNGEALLGPLPDYYQAILQYNEALKHRFWAYIDHRTGKVQWEDPRLGLLSASISIEANDRGNGNDELGDPRMTPKALRERGVSLKMLDLI